MLTTLTTLTMLTTLAVVAVLTRCAERAREGGAAAMVNLIPYNPTSAGDVRGFEPPTEVRWPLPAPTVLTVLSVLTAPTLLQ